MNREAFTQRVALGWYEAGPSALRMGRASSGASGQMDDFRGDMREESSASYGSVQQAAAEVGEAASLDVFGPFFEPAAIHLPEVAA